MKNENSKLMMEIARNIIAQYYKQLETVIKYYEEKGKSEEVQTDFDYESYITRAELQQRLIRTILPSFELIIFDGEIKEKETIYHKFGERGERIDVSVAAAPGVSRDETEFEIVKEGISKWFNILGIDPSALSSALWLSYNLLTKPKEVESDKKAGNPYDLDGNMWPEDNAFECGTIRVNNELLGTISGFEKTPAIPFKVYAEPVADIVKRALGNRLMNIDSDEPLDITKSKLCLSTYLDFALMNADHKSKYQGLLNDSLKNPSFGINPETR